MKVRPFTNGECQGTAYTPTYNALGGANFTTGRKLFFTASDMWFVSEKCLDAEVWYVKQGVCVGPTSARLLCPVIVALR